LEAAVNASAWGDTWAGAWGNTWGEIGGTLPLPSGGSRVYPIWMRRDVQLADEDFVALLVAQAVADGLIH
jgi:hypothetical protein